MNVFFSSVLLSTIHCKFTKNHSKINRINTSLSPKSETRCLLCAISPKSMKNTATKQKYKDIVAQMTPEQKRRYKIIGEKLFEIEQQNEFDKLAECDDIVFLNKLEENHKLQEQRRLTKLEQEIAKNKHKDSNNAKSEKKEAAIQCLEQVKNNYKSKAHKEAQRIKIQTKIKTDQQNRIRFVSQYKKGIESNILSKRKLLNESEKIINLRRGELDKQIKLRVKQINNNYIKERNRHLEIVKRNEEMLIKKQEGIKSKLIKQEAYTQNVMKIMGRPAVPETLLVSYKSSSKL
jgi:hypothetical protein